MRSKLNLKHFVQVVLITSIWINASEVFRYFVLVRPAVQEFWSGTDRMVADMNPMIFGVWGLWDTLVTIVLVVAVWLLRQSSENKRQVILRAATFAWAAIFLVFWVAAANMNLSGWQILLIALPLSWLEMLVGAWIALALFDRYSLKYPELSPETY